MMLNGGKYPLTQFPKFLNLFVVGIMKGEAVRLLLDDFLLLVTVFHCDCESLSIFSFLKVFVGNNVWMRKARSAVTFDL